MKKAYIRPGTEKLELHFETAILNTSPLKKVEVDPGAETEEYFSGKLHAERNIWH